MQLPASLSHWSHLLKLFPQEVARNLGHIITQLSTMVGPLKHNRLNGEIEPEGFGGITKTPHYERLLLSEWALHDQHIDEFIRRAAANEHLFLELTREDNADAKMSFVLFDCGPDQLGRPRIVQLAFLVLLARRAEAGGAHFRWGVIQDQKRQWLDTITEESIGYWLAQRSMALATKEDIDEWIGDETINDLWLVTAEAITTANTHYQVTLREPLFELDKITIDIIYGNQKKHGHITLPHKSKLPKLLRNPFEVHTKGDTIDDSFHYILSDSGRQIAFKDNNTIRSYRIGKNSKQKNINTHNFSIPENQKIIGINISKKRMSLLSSDQNHLYYHNFPGQAKILTEDRTQSIASSDCKKILLSNNNAQVAIVDSSNRLRVKDFRHDTLFKTLDHNVIFSGKSNNCIHYICHKAGDTEITVVLYLDYQQPFRKRYPIERTHNITVFFRSSYGWNKNTIGCLAFTRDDKQWTLIIKNQEHYVTIDDSQTVVGVIEVDSFGPQAKQQPGLVTIDSNNTVWIQSAQAPKRLLTLPSAFKTGEMNHQFNYLHYKDINNHFITLDLASGDELIGLESQ